MKLLDFIFKLYAFSYFLLFIYLFVQFKYYLEDMKKNQKENLESKEIEKE